MFSESSSMVTDFGSFVPTLTFALYALDLIVLGFIFVSNNFDFFRTGFDFFFSELS